MSETNENKCLAGDDYNRTNSLVQYLDGKLPGMIYGIRDPRVGEIILQAIKALNRLVLEADLETLQSRKVQVETAIANVEAKLAAE